METREKIERPFMRLDSQICRKRSVDGQLFYLLICLRRGQPSSRNCGVEKALVGADGGGRTHTPFRVLDFESSASANSATSA